MSEFVIDLPALRDWASLLPDECIDHGGDCCGTLCATCDHCCHSIANRHECADAACGCAEAIETDEIRFRRMVLALIDSTTQPAPHLSTDRRRLLCDDHVELEEPT